MKLLFASETTSKNFYVALHPTTVTDFLVSFKKKMSKGGGGSSKSSGGTRLVFGGIGGGPRKEQKITPGKPYVPKGTNVKKEMKRIS